MAAKTALRPSVRELLRDLKFRTDMENPRWANSQCWLSREDAGRHSLIVPAMYGPLDFLRLITVATVVEAIEAGLVTVGEPQPMPPYNYGGPKYRWRTIQQGRTIALTEGGVDRD